jgi:hypothetical protein
MRRFVKKRWHGIPIGIISAVLAVCLIAGGVLAAYNFLHVGVEVTVEEAIIMSIGAGDDLDIYCSGVCPDIVMTPSDSTLSVTMAEDPDVDASELTPGEWVVFPINLRNRSDASLTVSATASGGAGQLDLQYKMGDENGPSGSWADLNGWSYAMDPHEGAFGSQGPNATVLFVRVLVHTDAAPGTYSFSINFYRG